MVFGGSLSVDLLVITAGGDTLSSRGDGTSLESVCSWIECGPKTLTRGDTGGISDGSRPWPGESTGVALWRLEARARRMLTDDDLARPG